MEENELKVGEPVCSDIWSTGKVIRYEPETGYYLVDVGGMEVWSHKTALRSSQHQFQVGDQVAHIHKGNGVIVGFEKNSFGKMWPVLKLDNGCKWKSHPDHIRPRNFLSKIAGEQEMEYKTFDPSNPHADIPGYSKIGDQQLNEVFKPEKSDTNRWNDDRFQKNAYGQLVDTVTGLPADSEGIVAIKSIKDTVRSMG